MLSAKYDFAVENKVVANKNLISGANGCGEGLVVAVSDTNDHSRIGIAKIGMVDLHETKVSLTTTPKYMSVMDNDKASLFQSALDSLDKIIVRNRHIRVGLCRKDGSGKLAERNFFRLGGMADVKINFCGIHILFLCWMVLYFQHA